MNENECEMIKYIMAVIVRHHSGLGCDVLCEGDQCENCYLTAKDLYYEGYRKVADDEVVIKKSELARLKNLEINYEQVYEEYRKLEQERKSYRKVAEDEIVIKKSEYEELRLAKYKAMEEAIEYEKTAYQQFEQAKQEEAREILTTIYNNLKYATFKQTGALSSIKTLANELGIELE